MEPRYQSGGSLVGRAAMFQELIERLLSPNNRILDLGCETGKISSRLAARGFRVTACDVTEELIEAAETLSKFCYHK